MKVFIGLINKKEVRKYIPPEPFIKLNIGKNKMTNDIYIYSRDAESWPEINLQYVSLEKIPKRKRKTGDNHPKSI